MTTIATKGNWGTLALDVPDVLQDIRDSINNVAELLITALDVALIALRFVKAFLIGYLDPISAMVKAILDEIRALADDLRNLGIYITGDQRLLVPDFQELQGGFQEYERRMIARMTDRTDPTRPDVSSKSKVMAVFMYQSVDVADILYLVSFIKMLMRFFNQTAFPKGSPPVPEILDIRYGTQTASIFSFTTMADHFTTSNTPPNLAEVSWKINAAPSANPILPPLPMPPGGFLVTVSTFEKGMPLYYDRAAANSTKQDSTKSSTQVQPREHGAVRDFAGEPVVLHGGYDMLRLSPVFGYNQSLDGSGNIKDNRTRAYGIRSTSDEGVIPLDALYDGTNYYFQRTFVVSSTSAGIDWVQGEFIKTLKHSDMPHDAKINVASNGQITLEDLGIPATFYVRVATVTSDIGDGTEKAQYDLAKMEPYKDASGFPFVVPFAGKVERSHLSSFSQPKRVLFPNVYTAEYLKAIETALAVLALSRADLRVIDEVQFYEEEGDEKAALAKKNKTLLPGVAMQNTGLEKLSPLLGNLYENFAQELGRKNESPLSFRKDLKRRVHRMALDLYDRTGPMPDVEKFVVENTKELRAIKWSEILEDAGESDLAFFYESQAQLSGASETILGSLEDVDLAVGVAANPYCVGIPPFVVPELFYLSGLIRQRKPHFIEVEKGPAGDSTFETVQTATAAKAKTLIDSGPVGLREFYKKFIQADGTLKVDNDSYFLLTSVKELGRTEGSADMSPILFARPDKMGKMTRITTSVSVKDKGMLFCRTLFGKVKGNKVYAQTSVALGVAASAFRRPLADGEWLVLRAPDVFQGLEGALDIFGNWMESIMSATESVVDAIKKHIEFLEARLTELQQIIRRVNSMIQMILGFSFQIPKCSALSLLSDGTDGLLSDFISAKNKPDDSPLSYGAGAAIVIPLPLGSLAFDIIQVVKDDATATSTNPDSEAGAMPINQITQAVGTEETIPAPIPTFPEPDVL